VYEIDNHVLWDVLCDVQVIEDIRMMKAINKEWYTTCVQKLDVEVQGTHPPCWFVFESTSPSRISL
jgi:hypothetical protein